MYHVGECAQLFTFHAFEMVGFGNLGHFPFSFLLFFFFSGENPPVFDGSKVGQTQGDAWVKRMIITSDKSSSVFFEFPMRLVGFVFSGNHVSLFLVIVEPGNYSSSINVDVGVYLCP